MKKIFLFFIFIFFIGCSNKITIPIIKAPNEINNPKIRELKIVTKNDNINLKENLINQIYKINQIVPNYFLLNNFEYKSILEADVNTQIQKTIYSKIVKIHQKQPLCIYNFYPCKNIEGTIFCNKNTISMKLNPSQYDKIQKSFFKNGKYTLYNKNLYIIEQQCKPTKTTIKCQKDYIQIDVKVNIKDTNNKTIYTKTYSAINIDDPCQYIDVYNGKKIYTTQPLNEQLYILTNKLAKNIINDIAPHKEYIYTNFYDKSDVELSKKDNQLFKISISDKTNLNKKITILSSLQTKYPKSCVIPYDFAVYLVMNKNYEKAYNILNNIINSKCDDDIKNSSFIILNGLTNLY